MANYYAWSPIVSGDKSAKVGDSVSAGSLGIDKEEFDALVEGGAVREMKFPDMGEKAGQMSPMDFLRQKAAEAQGSELDKLNRQLVGLQSNLGDDQLSETVSSK